MEKGGLSNHRESFSFIICSEDCPDLPISSLYNVQTVEDFRKDALETLKRQDIERKEEPVLGKRKRKPLPVEGLTVVLFILRKHLSDSK